MGDRANIIIKQGEKDPIFLYTHWAGTDLPAILQVALERGKPRWNDDSYLTRIIFCEMIQSDVLGETGYGISTVIADNEHDYLAVDTDKQTVEVLTYDYTKHDQDPTSLPVKATYTFEEYIALDLEDGNPWDATEDESDESDDE